MGRVLTILLGRSPAEMRPEWHRLSVVSIAHSSIARIAPLTFGGAR